MSGMSVSVARIEQIQSAFARLSPRPVPTSRSTPPVTPADVTPVVSGQGLRLDSAALFARALSTVPPTLPVPSPAYGPPRTTAAHASVPVTEMGSAALAQAGAPAPVHRGVLDDGQTTGSDVVAAAHKYLGIPYVWGGTSTSGLDCSGLVQLVFRDLGISMPRVTYDQMREGAEVASLAQARPGDLVLTRNAGHIAIYLGDNTILHAPRPGKVVEISKLTATDAEITSIRRIVPADGGTDLVAAAQAASATGRAG